MSPLPRRIFIGDIQGCRDELQRLLDRLRFDPAADELHPVGDFVNRGPDSAGTLRLARELGAGGVIGNHDLHLLRASRGEREPKPRDTFHDVLEAHDREDLLAWLAARPFIRAWPDVLLVHAGLKATWTDPERALSGLDPFHPGPEGIFAVRVRYCTPSGELTDQEDPPPPPPFAPWFEHWLAASDDPRTLVYGHWSRMGLLVHERLRGLDSGCVWGGALSAWIAEEDRIEQVPAARMYSPIGE